VNDLELNDVLRRLSPKQRDVLRRAARAEQWERDELSMRLLRESGGNGLADFIDGMSIDPTLRRQVARVLGNLEATE
jgi:hypothetical protein